MNPQRKVSSAEARAQVQRVHGKWWVKVLEGEPETLAWYCKCREGVWAGKEMEQRLPQFS